MGVVYLRTLSLYWCCAAKGTCVCVTQATHIHRLLPEREVSSDSTESLLTFLLFVLFPSMMIGTMKSIHFWL